MVIKMRSIELVFVLHFVYQLNTSLLFNWTVNSKEQKDSIFNGFSFNAFILITSHQTMTFILFSYQCKAMNSEQSAVSLIKPIQLHLANFVIKRFGEDSSRKMKIIPLG